MPDTVGDVGRIVGQNVSRETLERLKAHLALLTKWNPAINLVSPSTLSEGWHRHIIDSAQLFSLPNRKDGHWLDFGTGGGFPGLVCAILADDLAPGLRFTFVESDKRKSAFLANAVRSLGLSASIRSERIESLPPQRADIISARAVAALPKLLDYAYPHLSPGGICLFPKGARYRDELRSAEQHWRFKVVTKPSITEPNAVVLHLGEIERV